MKKIFKSIYEFWHICEPDKLYSIYVEKTNNIITKQINEYECNGLFCNKKIKIRIV
jgi:hypothetical protein